MRNKIFQSQLQGVAFALSPSLMSSLMMFANTDTVKSEELSIRVANDSVEYQTRGNVAVISVDGAMAKKGYGGMCMSIASYEQMVIQIDKAEADDAVKTILFRVDTGGGAVDGADEVGERIFNSSKRTITLYENTGASGGIWVFSASDEVYATETTMLGSIGVVVSYLEESDENNKRIDIVSKNAENKRCSLNGDCKEKIQVMLDAYEDIFYSRVIRNTGFSAEDIKKNFNNGGMIFAKEAKENGFIKDITTFDSLMKSLNKTASAGGIIANLNTGADMKFDGTEEQFNALMANKTTMESRNETLKVDLQTKTTALEAKTDEMTKLAASHEAELSEANGKLESFKVETTTRVQEGMKNGASAEAIVSAMSAETPEEASKIIMAHKESGGHTNQNNEHKPEKSAVLAYAEQNKGSIK